MTSRGCYERHRQTDVGDNIQCRHSTLVDMIILILADLVVLMFG